PRSAAGAARLGSADAAPPSVRAVRRWKVMPSAVATSPTASKARSSETTSSTSPGCAPASHTPALTAMRRSLQSRTPVDGALWTSWAPWRASRRAVSWPITRQLPTATNSVLRPRWSMASRSITRSMCAGWLVFSTSKKIACRVVGRRRSGPGGGRRRERSVRLRRADADGLGGLQAVRDVGQRSVELPQQAHNAPEGLSHRRPLAAQRIELALERTVGPAKLAQLSAEALGLLLSRFHRAPQAIALI